MCGVGAKSVAHLMKFHLLQWEIIKVKFLINSNMTLTVLNPHQKTDPRCNKTLKVKVTTRSKVKSRSHHDACTPTTPNQCPYQASTSYTLRFPRYSPDKIFKLKVTTARSKVQLRSDHDVAHLHPLTNVPAKYQLPTPYDFWDRAQTNFFPPPTHPPIWTPWVKTIPRQPLRAVG